MPFEFKRLEIKDVILIEPIIFKDSRGFFMETYKQSDFVKNGIKENFIQDNHSYSVKNVLRGLHYQLPPFAQAKLVRCLKGEIFDVAVDLRKNSKTFGMWIGEILSDKNKKMLYIPAGFAHGFITLSDEAEVFYKVTSEYSKNHDRGIIWNDPDISINWGVKNPILSEKDSNLPLLKNAEVFE